MPDITETKEITLETYLKRFSLKPFDANTKIKAGDILKLKNGEYHLVGSVNEVLGVCEDCTIFKESDIEAIGSIVVLELSRGRHQTAN